MFSLKNCFLKKSHFVFIVATVMTVYVKAQSGNSYTLTNNDVEVDDGTIVSCNYSFAKKNIVIPEILDGQKVTGISTKVFAEKGITTVILPNSLRTIGPGAFAKNSFVRLQLPDSLKIIEDYAFAKSKLTSILLPPGLEKLGEYAFSENFITKITIPESVESIEKFAFSFNGLKEIVYYPKTGYSGIAFNKNNVTKINGKQTKGILYKVQSDGSIDSTNIIGYCGEKKVVDFIPLGIDTISIKAFVGCDIASVIIPEGVKYLGEEAFLNNALKQIKFPNTLTAIGPGCFENNQLTKVVLPPYLKTVGARAFGYNKIVNVVLSDSLKRIEGYAFYRNDILSVKLPKGLEYIGYNAFADNELSGIVLPSSIIEFEADAFYGNNFTSFILPTPTSEDFIEWQSEEKETVPCGYKIRIFRGTYKAYFKHVLTRKDVYIEDGIIKRYSSYYKHIIIPDKINGQTVLGINNEVFSNRGLCSVKFPETLLEIGDEAFYGNNLKEIKLPKDIEFVGEKCFYANYAESFYLPVTHDTNFMYWFVGGEYTIKSGVWIKDMKHEALYKCVKKVLDTSDVTIEDHVITEYKGNNKFIFIPNEIGGQVIKGIYEAAFYKKKLYYVRLPDSLTAIGPSAFAFNHLTSIKIPSRVNRIYSYAFHGNEDLEQVEIKGPSKLLFIGTGAFDLTDVKSITLPERPDIKKAYWKDNDKHKYLPGTVVTKPFSKYYLDVKFKKYLE